MFRWLILTQAVIYLLVMPYLRGLSELGYNPPLMIGLYATAALAIGCFWPGKMPLVGSTGAGRVHIEPRRQLWIFILLWVLVYAYVSINFGLLNRRQGSEFMAELYASVPLWALAILRGYELLLVPIILIYGFAARAELGYQRLIVGLALLASLPFMGIADSRGRLLVIAIYIVCFIPAPRFFGYLTRNVRIYIGGALALGAFFFYSFQRSSQYYSLNDYLLVEVYSRLDGLNIVTQLRDANLLPNFGQFDLAMFEPLISKIPFLEAAQTAKLLGRTSSKQYYIQDLLKSARLDDSNSLVADPMYFAGIAGVIGAFLLLGLAIRRFDRFIASDGMFVRWLSTIVAMAFVTSFAVFENDFVGAFAAFVQTAAVLTSFILVGCRKSELTRGRAGYQTPSLTSATAEPMLVTP